MRNPELVPCLWFDAQAEEAAAFYTRLFPEGRVNAVSRYPGAGDNPSGRPPGSVLTVEFTIAGRRFTALNGGPIFVPNPTLSFFVEVESPEQATRLFNVLSDGGEALMPLASYPWSPRYGWVKDRFGISWQVMAGRSTGPLRLVPCLMFSGAQAGRAADAVQRYTAVFPDSRVESVERYAEGEGPVAMVKHARFTLAGQPFVATDSHLTANLAFNEALSLQVMCEDQAEIDRYWEALSEGGSKGPCGWLKDAWGFSWQVAPERVVAWLTGPDVAARERVFAALLKMTKLDLATLERAFTSA